MWRSQILRDRDFKGEDIFTFYNWILLEGLTSSGSPFSYTTLEMDAGLTEANQSASLFFEADASKSRQRAKTGRTLGANLSYFDLCGHCIVELMSLGPR